MKTSSTANRDWKELFLKNKEHYKDNLKSVGSAFVAFNVNTDAIISINDEFLKIINFKDVSKNCKLPKEINSLKSLKDAVAYSFIKGLAQELKIDNESFYEYLINNLPFKERRIGGQAGIAANTLADLGVRKVIVYASILSKKQAMLFHKNVVFPTLKNDKIIFIPATSAGRSTDPTRVNIIIEYKKGTKVELKEGTVIIPRNSRFIISHQPYKSQPLIPSELLIPNLFKGIKRMFLSGYHHISEDEADDVFKECINQINTIKKIEEECMIHLEYVDLHKEWIKKNITKMLYYIDSFGLNEVETLNFMKFQSESKIADDIEESDFSADSLVKAGIFLAKKFRLKRVNIHFIDFIISITKKDYPVSVERLLEANMFGMRVVNSKGVAGEDFIKELGRTDKYSLNNNGVKAALKTYKDNDFNIIVVPNLEPDKKFSYTVGLGDTVSSSTFFGELVK